MCRIDWKYLNEFIILIGMMIFTQSEGWSYLDSSYFCITSLLKVYFGIHSKFLLVSNLPTCSI